MNPVRLALAGALALFLAQDRSDKPARATPYATVHGRCANCRIQYSLDRLQFLSDTEGWAAGFAVFVSNGHVSQPGTVLHTKDGGRTWTALRQVETYGIDYEPSFSFLGIDQGLVAWTTTSDPFSHLLRTVDKGRRWRTLNVEFPGLIVDFHAFSSRLVHGCLSTFHGPVFGVSEVGGTHWTSHPLPVGYPGVCEFIGAHEAWIGSGRHQDNRFSPALVRTDDGGSTWTEGAFPASTTGIVQHIARVDDRRAWIILGNTGGADALFRTADGGANWTRFAAPTLNAAHFLSEVFFASTEIGFAFGADKTADGESGTPLMFTTTDGGESWVAAPLPHPVSSCQQRANDIWCSAGLDILKLGVPR